MQEITLKIPEEKYPFMLELFEQLGLEVSNDHEIPEWQKNIVRERIAEYEKNPDDAIPWDEVRKNLNFRDEE